MQEELGTREHYQVDEVATKGMQGYGTYHTASHASVSIIIIYILVEPAAQTPHSAEKGMW